MSGLPESRNSVLENQNTLSSGSITSELTKIGAYALLGEYKEEYEDK